MQDWCRWYNAIDCIEEMDVTMWRHPLVCGLLLGSHFNLNIYLFIYIYLFINLFKPLVPSSLLSLSPYWPSLPLCIFYCNDRKVLAHISIYLQISSVWFWCVCQFIDEVPGWCLCDSDKLTVCWVYTAVADLAPPFSGHFVSTGWTLCVCVYTCMAIIVRTN